jgi:hypothetical protein
MTEPAPFGAPVEPEAPIVEIDAPFSLRPDLSELGIEETDRGVCADTFENRSLLRSAKLGWDPVYASNGVPTGLIAARSKDMVLQRRIISLAEKRPIMVDPESRNSDYLTGLDLLAESATDHLVPPWVIGSTRAWVAEQEAGGPKTAKLQPKNLPHRCRAIKDDTIRCMLWSSGRPKDDGLCRVHLGVLKRLPGDDVERARAKLTQAAPYAVDVLEDLMLNAESEPVKLKASTEILDRAGVRGGVEIDTNLSIEVRPAASIINERLERLARGAIETAARLAEAGLTVPGDPDPNVVDAEVVEERTEDADEEPQP